MTLFVISTNSYMFWHQSAIWESTDTEDQKFMDSMKMALQCQNIGVGPYHKLFFVICMLLYQVHVMVYIHSFIH